MDFRTLLTVTGIGGSDADIEIAADLCEEIDAHLSVLVVALAAIYLYGRALAMGIRRSQCILRYPMVVMSFWAAVAAADLTWLLVFR